MVKKQIATAVFCLLLPVVFSVAQAQSCGSFNFSGGRSFEKCTTLGKLGAYLDWTYNPTGNTVEIAFRAQQGSNGFVAWALNPTGSGMVGAETLVALQNSSGAMWAYTTSIQNKGPDMKPSSLPNIVADKLSAELSGGYMVIYATVTLPASRTTLNHVWQSSTSISGGIPVGHAYSGDNLQSFGSIDFLSGTAAGGSSSTTRRKNVHGIINGIAWGVLMPMGVIFARYVKVFADPTWFYLHVACQTTAYGLGVAGVATGIKLGNDSEGITYKGHRNIGIALLCMATLQVLAMLLRPNKDHKYRIFWNIYHHSVGYSVLILSAINIFKGFDILKPDNDWKRAYIAILSTLGGIALVLEVVTWIVVLKRRKAIKSSNAVNGHGQTRI